MFKNIVILVVIAFFTHVTAVYSEETKPISDTKQVKAEIIVSPESMSSIDRTAAWLLYASVGAKWIDEEYLKRYPHRSEYRFTFEEEIEARESLAKFWTDMKKDNPRNRDRYLDKLLEVYNSGFMKEYVWHYFYYREWDEEPEGLRHDEFTKYRKKYLRSHKPETLAMARPVRVKKSETRSDSPVMARQIPSALNSPSDSEEIVKMYNAAIRKADAGKYDEAITLYQKIIELDPMHTDAMDNLGVIYRKMGNYDKAVDLYKISLSLVPTNRTALINMGVALLLLKKFEDASQAYEKIKQLNPDDPEGYFGAGHVYRELGQFDKALQEFKTAKDLYHKSKSPYERDVSLIIEASENDRKKAESR